MENNPEQKKWHDNENTDMLMKINFNTYKVRQLLERILEEGIDLRAAGKTKTKKTSADDDFLAGGDL